ncbi:hypothetical protein FOZ62_006643, partial [Perkinsus olseni]
RIVASRASHSAVLLQVRHFNKSCGLVGYPNVGKSTTFNAILYYLVQEQVVKSGTIEPNISKASVPDPLLDDLAKVEGSAKKIPGQLEVRDIAGLVKGASEGQGMGNSFLANIRHVHCIIQDELLIADLEMATRKMPGLRKRACAEPEAKK